MSETDLRAENERLRTTLAEGWLFEMTYQNEPDDPSVYSEGWMCCGCMDSWPDGDRPPADSKEEVRHHPTCVLYMTPERERSEAERVRETLLDVVRWKKVIEAARRALADIDASGAYDGTCEESIYDLRTALAACSPRQGKPAEGETK